MHLFALVLGIWLLPKADTLTCYQCGSGASGGCTETKVCPSANHQCGAFRVLTYAGGVKFSDIQTKSCALAEECVEGSVNYGTAKVQITSKCCNSDRCNSQHVPNASQSLSNGKKCFACEGETCTKTLNCQGNEDHCIKTTIDVEGVKVTAKGCASSMICTAASNQLLSGFMGANINCCQGDLCNSASRASAGVLLFVVPLVSVVLFS